MTNAGEVAALVVQIFHEAWMDLPDSGTFWTERDPEGWPMLMTDDPSDVSGIVVF